MHNIEKLRQQILQCARDIVQNKGYKLLTISEISQKCHISKSTFYLCFSSKEELLELISCHNTKSDSDILSMKEEIAHNAMRLFCTKGFANTEMTQIAEASKITKAAIYHYFNNKEDLLKYCVRIEIDKRKQFVENIKRSVGDPLQRLLRFIEFSSESAVDSNFILLVNSRSIAFINEDVSKVYDEFMQYRINVYTETIELGIKNGSFQSSIDAKGLSEIIVTFFNGLSLTPTVRIGKLQDALIGLLYGLLNK